VIGRQHALIEAMLRPEVGEIGEASRAIHAVAAVTVPCSFGAVMSAGDTTTGPHSPDRPIASRCFPTGAGQQSREVGTGARNRRLLRPIATSTCHGTVSSSVVDALRRTPRSSVIPCGCSGQCSSTTSRDHQDLLLRGM
jgi:hypothetical protein